MSRRRILPPPPNEILESVTSALKESGPARGIHLNNALTLSLGAPGELRAKSLRTYLEAMLDPILPHADGVPAEKIPPIMTPQELVTVLLAGALFVHTDRVLMRGVAA